MVPANYLDENREMKHQIIKSHAIPKFLAVITTIHKLFNESV